MILSDDVAIRESRLLNIFQFQCLTTETENVMRDFIGHLVALNYSM